MTAHVLTARQARVLAVIRAFIGAEGRPPSHREIADRIGVSAASTVASHLAALERAGAIHRIGKAPHRRITVDGTCPTCGQNRRTT